MKEQLVSDITTVHALVFFDFRANSWSNQDIFELKIICTPMEIIPEKFNTLELAVLEELANKQTHRRTGTLLP